MLVRVKRKDIAWQQEKVVCGVASGRMSFHSRTKAVSAMIWSSSSHFRTGSEFKARRPLVAVEDPGSVS